MSSIATLNGVQYIIPAYNDTGWAQGTGNLSQYLAAIASATLQPTGGAFTLTAEADFGASYGLKALYIKSETATPSTVGVLRLASADTIGWRNNAGGADITLSKDTSDNLKFNATKVLLSGAVVNADINASAAIAYSKLALTGAILNADLAGSIAYSKLSLTGAILNADLAGSIAVNKLVAVTASRALVSDASGFVSASAVTSATLAFLDATSSVQTQLNSISTVASAALPKGGGTMTGAIAFNPSTAGITGTITNNNAAAGTVGETMSASQTTLTNVPSTGTYGDMVTLPLTKGDWLVYVGVDFNTNGATVTDWRFGISTSSGNAFADAVPGDNFARYTGTPPYSASFHCLGSYRVSIGSDTTHYGKIQASFSVATPQYRARMTAERIR